MKQGEKEYQYPLYHLSGNEIQSHGTMTYEGPKSIVFFHAYQAGSPGYVPLLPVSGRNDAHAVS